MKVYLNALSITDICPAHSLEDFVGANQKPVMFAYAGRKRALGMAMRDGFVVGLLTTATYQSKDPLLVSKPDGTLHFVVHDTSADGERHSLNFFAINAATGMGLVSRHQGAGSVVSFGKVLRNRHTLSRRASREKQIEALQKQKKVVEILAVRARFLKGKFVCTPVFREGTFETLLKSLSVITELSYDEPDVNDKKYLLVKDQLRLDHRTLKFEIASASKGRAPSNSARGKIVQFIRDVIINRNVRVAVAKGKDSHGSDMPPVSISPDVDSFGDFPYNDVVVAENVAISSVAAMPMITKMLKVARSHPGIFMTPR